MISPAVSRGNELYNTNSPALARWPSSETIHIHVHVLHIVTAATIQGRCLICSEPLIVRLLFKGGVYSRAVSIRGRRLFEKIQ